MTVTVTNRCVSRKAREFLDQAGEKEENNDFFKFSIPKCYNIQIHYQRQSINTTFILSTKVYMSGRHVST